MAKSGGFKAFINWVKTFWTDSFKWDCVKSVSLFIVGIVLARDLKGVSVMGQPQF